MTSRYCRQHPTYARCLPVVTKEEEATLLLLEDFIQAVKQAASQSAEVTLDAHNALGSTTKGAVDLATLPIVLRDVKAGHDLLKELGYFGKYYLKIQGGKTYVIFRGYAGLRATISGTRYLAQSAQMLSLGIGKQAIVAAGLSNGLIMIACYVALDVAQFILSDEKIYSELFANIIVDIGIGVASLVAGAVAAFLGGGHCWSRYHHRYSRSCYRRRSNHRGHARKHVGH